MGRGVKLILFMHPIRVGFRVLSAILFRIAVRHVAFFVHGAPKELVGKAGTSGGGLGCIMLRYEKPERKFRPEG